MSVSSLFASITAAFLLAGGLMGPQPSVEDIAWMTGDRAQRSDKAEVREVWIGPGNGVLLGMSLTRRFDGGKGEFEHMRIETRPDGTLVFISRPSGQPEAEFPLASYNTGLLIFENPRHDFPQRITYRDKGEGIIEARIEGKLNGKPRSAQWTFSPRQ